MNRSVVLLVVFLVAAFVGFQGYTWHHRQLETAYVTGLLDGAKIGELRGIFTCPCWDREGSFCSLCGIQLTKANIFQIINDD